MLAYALIGFTRSGLGTTSTQTSRYLYFGGLFCGPASQRPAATSRTLDSGGTQR